MELKLIPATLPQMHELVKLAFDGDTELLNLYHISPGTLDHCVVHTMNFIVENEAAYKQDMEFYSVRLNGIKIGYTVVIRNEHEPNELYSFGININYRKSEILEKWMAEIKNMLGGSYFVALWGKNKRAINFMERNGLEVYRISHYLNEEIKSLRICPQEVS